MVLVSFLISDHFLLALFVLNSLSLSLQSNLKKKIMKILKAIYKGILVSTILSVMSTVIVSAQALPKLVNCLSSTGAITVRAKKCPKTQTLVNINTLKGNGIQGPAGTAGSVGPIGPQGPAGADGQLKVYGDGSRGDFVAAAGGFNVLNSANLQFNNFLIPSGTAVEIPSGATVRCKGTFTNNGQISIQDGSRYPPVVASNDFPGGSPSTPSYFGNFAYTGGSKTALTPGATSGNGGLGGRGISINISAQATTALRPHNLGGGAGGNSSLSAGNGGGFVTILCAGAIINTSNIFLSGGNSASGGGGGGAGGILVLASATSVTNTGNIIADGGDGAAAGSTGTSVSPIGYAAGGGGAGGIVHLISPLNSNTGSISVLPGSAGANSAPLTFTTASNSMTGIGGGGGGGCYNDGGDGGSVNVDANITPSNRKFTFNPAKDGNAGIVLTTVANPTSLF